METLLGQAIRLTVLGMGMTFLSIGALVGGMYLMTYLTRNKGEKAVAEVEGKAIVGDLADERVRRQRAAAAAVAVAMALARAKPVGGMSLADAREWAREIWNSHVRDLHLSRRVWYESRRRR